MKQTIDIISGGSTKFNAGQSGKYLILRQASQSIILKGDNLRPVELERGDVVDVSRFDELEIHNHNSTSVHVEFQVSDVEVRIRTSSTAINGALNINEIQSPIEISRIQEPIDVQVSIPEVEVSIPDVAVTMPSELTIANLPDTQKVEITNQPEEVATSINYLGNLTVQSSTTSVAANENRKGLIFYAPKTNQEDVIINQGIFVSPGGHNFIQLSGSTYFQGHSGDQIRITELL